MAVTISFTADSSGVTQETAKVSASLSAAFASIQAQLKGMEAASTHGSTAMVQGLDAITQATKATARATQVMAQDMSTAMKGLEQSIRPVSQGWSTLQASMTRLVGVLATIRGAIGLKDLATDAVNTAATFEQLDTQLKFVVGSMQEFAQARQFILQFTATTPLQLGEVTKAFIDLTRRGFEVQRTMKAVADVASLQLFPSEAFQHIIFQLGQIADRAKLTGDNLKDLSTSGVSIGRVTEELRAMGVVIQGDIGDASVSAAQGIEAIVRVLEKDFRDATLATAGNWKTLVSNLQDTWAVFQDFIVRGPLLDFLKGLVSLIGNELTRAVREDQAAFEAWGASAVKWIQTVIVNVAGLVDGLSIIAEPIISASRALYTFAQQFDVFTNDLLSRALGGVAGALESLFAPEATVQAMRRAAEAVKGKGTGDIFLKSVLPTEGAAKSRVTSILGAIGQETSRLQAEQADILQKRQAANAQQQRKLSETVAGESDKAAKSRADKRAREEQQALEKSLQAQVALVAQSFDERRQIIDQKFSEDLAREPLRVKELSEIRTTMLQAMAVEEARFVEQVQMDSLSRQALTAEEFAAKREVIVKRTGEVELKASQQTLAQQIKAAEELVSLTDRVNEQILDRDEKMQAERTRLLNQELEQQQRAYEQFSQRVVGFLDDIFQGLLSGTLSAVDFFKNLLIRQLSNIAANILGPLVTSISAGLAGGLGSMLSPTLGKSILGTLGLTGGTGAAGGTDIIGLGGMGLQIRNFFSPDGMLGQGLSWFTDNLFDAGNSIANIFGRQLVPEGWQGPLQGGLQATPFNPLQSIGGLISGITGLIGALKAKDTAGRVIGGLGAGLGLAGMIPGPQQPFLLAASAIVQLLGPMIAKMFSPAGPRFALGGLGGLGIGTGAGGLTVTGDLTSRIGRAERLPGGVDVDAIQSQLAASVTGMVKGMVTAINTAALKPDDLLASTQKALNDAMTGALTINSSSAKNFQQDMTDQLKFVTVQIGSFFLAPLVEAFRQLESSDIDEQIQRLPSTTAGMTQVFKAMNDQLAELSKVANTDVLRQLSSVRTRVEDFGNALADTARVVATDIVDSLVTKMTAQAKTTLDLPLAKQITEFSDLLTESLQAFTALKATQGSLQSVGLNAGGVTTQLDLLSKTMIETSASVARQIVTESLQQLTADIGQFTTQAVSVQAVTVNALFTDSLQALAALQQAWSQLNAVGLDSQGIQEQFTTLLGGMLEGAFKVITEGFAGGSFANFLTTLISLPTALTSLNPTLQKVQDLGKAFAQLSLPLEQTIQALQEEMRTPAERIARATQTMAELRNAIGEAGDSAEKALPLYAKLAEQIQANAQAQIDAVNEQAQVQIDAANEVAEAQRQVLQETVQVWTDEVNALADSQRTELEKVVDYWTDVANTVADSQLEALQQVIAVWTDEVNTLASSQREELDRVIDYWTDVANMVADSQREEMDRIVDVWTEGVQALADSQREEMDRIVETWTDAVNAIADAEMSAMDRWVETTTQMVNDWADSANTAASQLSQVNDILRQEMSPALQRQTLEARKAAIQTRMDAGGPNAQASIGELIQINTDLLALAKQSDDLMQQKQMINELSGMQKALRDQVVAMTGESDPLLAQLTIADQSKKVLEDIAAYQKWQTGVIAGEQQARLEEIAAYQKWQAFVITGTQQAKLEEIAAYQKWQTSVITGEQQATLANIAANQAHAAWVIAGEQQARLADIAAYEKWQTDVIAVQQQAALDTIAANEAYATSVMTGEQQARLAEIEAYEAAQLAYIQSTQDARLKEIGDWQKATVTAIKQDMVYQLQLVQYEIQKLFALQYKALTGVDLPAPTPPPPRQQSAAQGGLIGIASGSYYAHGGMVPDPAQRFARGGLINAMLEPGERVFSPTTKAQQGALLSMNQAFPRLAAGGMVVPGSGSGDTVPAFLRSGSVVLNRRASTVVGALGMQDGGPVPASRGVPVVNIHIAKLEVRNDADIKAIIDGITRQLSREWRSSNDKGPFR